MSAWRPALRIARRTAQRSPGRTVLVAALIGVPVAAAVFVAILLRTVDPSGERLASIEMGTADATILVTEYASVRLEPYVWGTELSWRPRSETSRARQTEDIDVSSLLPAGTTITPVAETTGGVTVDGVRATYDVRLLDGTSWLNDGRFRLEAGRMPTAPGEIAVSVPLAARYGWSTGHLGPGATLTTVDGHRHLVTGIASPIRGIGDRMIWAPPGSALFTDAPGPERYLVDLPERADVAALQRSLAAEGVVLTPRAAVVDPPSDNGTSGWDEPEMIALLVLFAGFGVLEIMLLAGAAFAVGARRQVRDLGLVGAQGGTARDVRRIVLAQGVVLGLLGSAAGVVVGVVVALAGRPLWEPVTDTAITGWDVPLLVVAAVTAIGVAAGLGAAVVPARTAYRMPVVAALNARFHAESLRTRIPLRGVVLVAAGVAVVVAGSALLGAEFAAQRAAQRGYGVTPTGPIALVLAGITLVVAGLVWILPRLVATIARIGAVMPLSVRLAVRDAGRHRHRTGPAAAAIMMAVAASVALSYAVANQLVDEQRYYLPVTRHGDAVLPVKSPDDDPYQPAPVYSPELLERVTAELPVERTFLAGGLYARAAPGSPLPDYLEGASITMPGGCGPGCRVADPVRVIDPAMLTRLAGDAARDEIAALEAGKVVVTSARAIRDGMAHINLTQDPAGAKLPLSAVIATGLPRTGGDDGAVDRPGHREDTGRGSGHQHRVRAQPGADRRRTGSGRPDYRIRGRAPGGARLHRLPQPGDAGRARRGGRGDAARGRHLRRALGSRGTRRPRHARRGRRPTRSPATARRRTGMVDRRGRLPAGHRRRLAVRLHCTRRHRLALPRHPVDHPRRNRCRRATVRRHPRLAFHPATTAHDPPRRMTQHRWKERGRDDSPRPAVRLTVKPVALPRAIL